MNGEETVPVIEQAHAEQTVSHAVHGEATAHETVVASPVAEVIAAAVETSANPAVAVVEPIAHTAQVATAVTAEPTTPSVESVAVVNEETRKRPVLNPNVDEHQTRAVGSIGAEVESEAVAVAAAAAAQTEAAITSRGPVGQIELPPKQVSLDDGLEQEIDAAMSGQMTAPTAPPVGAATPNPSSTAEELPSSEDQLEAGTKLKAKVQSVTADDVFCEVGYRSPGVLPARQFPQG